MEEVEYNVNMETIKQIIAVIDAYDQHEAELKAERRKQISALVERAIKSGMVSKL